MALGFGAKSQSNSEEKFKFRRNSKLAHFYAFRPYPGHKISGPERALQLLRSKKWTRLRWFHRISRLQKGRHVPEMGLLSGNGTDSAISIARWAESHQKVGAIMAIMAIGEAVTHINY
jgi:hypothetical protein